MMIPLSIGMGLTFVPVTLLATSRPRSTDVAGLASGLFNTSQQIGGALGLAVLSTIAVNRTDDALQGLPGDSPNPIRAGRRPCHRLPGRLLAAAPSSSLGGLVLLADDAEARATLAEVDVRPAR